ncbi:HK97-gp10 family putative phage morphogenesis protein [Chitinimonas sp. PSY-7]|uniref:HK97-gp10 family putative phage morphogenesis protein n=1 Tax=Chitinimonas sp. PSY-7 TaxID=3459088 RepID=UPI00404008CB
MQQFDLDLARIDEVLKQLPARVEANILRGALRAGAEVIAEDARNRVVHVSGDLADSVRVSARVYRRAGKVVVSIKAGSQAGKGRKNVYYANMVEFGTRRHEIKPKYRRSLFVAGVMRQLVRHPGAKAKPFMRPALDTKAQAALTVASDYLRARLPKALTKAGLPADTDF